MFYIRKTWAILIILLGAQFIGLGLFSKGFFPYKKILSGFAKVEDLPRYPNGKEALPPEPLFDRLVFMLVDALRSDFVFGENSGMEFVKSLIESHRAIPYTAHASAPTVTLPRIKALTTGTFPNFLDAIFNIAESDTSSLEFQDNWLTQLKNARNMTISFFGDDTWIKLFPGIFKVTDGTSSLFATDTVEVDLNVTRNVIPQLLSPEWDALIFHYLGLDHIGHSSGPYSPLMIPKQREMDHVVKTIYDIIVEQDEIRIKNNANAKPTLFVLCGDHGMNEAGNHGGSSIGETTTAFVFMSSKFNYMNYRNHIDYTDYTDHDHSLKFYKLVNQIDFVPTLSFAFGIPIPSNNLGKVMLDIFVDVDPLERLRALQLNAHQLSGILLTLWNSFTRDPEKIEEIEKIEKICFNSDKDEETRLQCLYLFAYYFHSKALESFDEESIKSASLFYKEFITEASYLLSSSSSDYNIESMCWGLLFMGFASISFILILTSKNIQGKMIFINKENYRLDLFVTLSIVAFCVTLFASSFIEEEHQFWYFWMQTAWFGLLFNSFKSNNYLKDSRLTMISLGQMILVRLIRSWNQTGQKYAGEVDIRFYLNRSYVLLMWILIFGSMIFFTIETLSTIYSSLSSPNSSSNSKSKSSIIGVIYKFLAQLLVIVVAISIIKYKIIISIVDSGGGELIVDNTINRLFPEILLWMEYIIPISIPVSLARIIYTILFLLLFWIITLPLLQKLIQAFKGLQITTISKLLLHLSTYLFILLSRPHNIPLYLLYYIQYILLSKWIKLNMKYGISISPLTINYILMCLKLMTFFSLGNSNSLASIDISNSYIGINEYNVIIVGMLTFLANWSGSIWWVLAGNLIKLEIIELRINKICLERRIQVIENYAVESYHKSNNISGGSSVSGISSGSNINISNGSSSISMNNAFEEVFVENNSTSLIGSTYSTTIFSLLYSDPKEDDNLVDMIDMVDVVDVIEDMEDKYIEDDDYNNNDNDNDNNDNNDNNNNNLINYSKPHSSNTSNTSNSLNSLSQFLAKQQQRNLISKDNEAIIEREQIINLVEFKNSIYYTISFHSLIIFILSVGVTILRDHLFIWTVFSPKYLYQIIWCVLFQFLIELIGGGIIWWISGNVRVHL
ncbi:hypothetical protein Glove_461g70 [Diversispora epigaea]|uniref:GPI ethanolamine phosphate transferase 2 n=1 Tax=Diversispora epigaea TaxID=1348612 RepID=A0A397GQ36_9GLOM|nr:hypothetical protein Glove_461g70 [Diversispora epigaea]